MSTKKPERWCLFTSAGDNNAIRLWLEGATPRQWDLITAYYGDNEQEFSEISKLSSYAFRGKGGKFQILKNFVVQNPRCFDQYSYVWVCDDDIRMSAAQIEEAFAITELSEFWVAQPAFLPEGKNWHPITVYAGPQCDYRVVNFVELGAPIFRRDKLTEFLAVYDGTLTGHGIDFWYLNFFRAHELGRFQNFFRPNELGRFAVIDKVQVTNPHDVAKGGREIDRLQPEPLRQAAWIEARAKYGLVEFPLKVFASRKITFDRNQRATITSYDIARQIAIDFSRSLEREFVWLKGLKVRGWNAFMDFRFKLLRVLARVRRLSFDVPGAMPPHPRTLAERLGCSSEVRLLIVHADDFAFANAVNLALINGLGTGLINSGSVMVPCPWFPEVAAFARTHPEADLGLHLTLTSERTAYRWGPTAPITKVPSLIDRQYYFHRTWTSDTRINSREVEIELRAQIEKAYAAGLRPTHLDSHQYRLQKSGRRLFEVYLRLGRDYDLPVFVARNWFTQFPYLPLALTSRDAVIDQEVTIGDEVTPQQWPAYYRRAVESLQPGVTEIVIHPGLDNAELQALCADRPTWGAAWRQRDFDFFTSEEFRDLLAKHDIKLITWREIGTRLRHRAQSSF
jgi:chitin disaccharide deacetylase